MVIHQIKSSEVAEVALTVTLSITQVIGNDDLNKKEWARLIKALNEGDTLYIADVLAEHLKEEVDLEKYSGYAVDAMDEGIDIIVYPFNEGSPIEFKTPQIQH